MTKNYYDGIAKGYSNLYHLEQKLKINKIKSYLNNFSKVLDCGSGDGVLNNFFEDSVELYSIDLSENLLKLNSNLNTRKFLGNIEDLPFKDDFFDLCVTFTVLQDLENPNLAISEISRVLKTNGRFICSFLKLASKKDIIISNIKKFFDIIYFVEEEKDYIYVLKKRN